jgi:formylglycine-generating enzyme required for sulfatase activity
MNNKKHILLPCALALAITAQAASPVVSKVWAQHQAGPALADTSLIDMESHVWKYYSASDLGTTWLASGFDDSEWPSGTTMFGSETTPAEYPLYFNTPILAPREGGTITVYFRTHFTFNGLPDTATLTASNLLDDGAVFYLNGQYAGAVRVAEAPNQVFSTLATNQPNEGTYDVISLPTTNLLRGDNILEVELHDSSATSSDKVFALSLYAGITNRIPAASPVVSNVRAQQRAGTKLVDITYDLADPDSTQLAVSIAVSTNAGACYTLPATSFTGALGVNQSPGQNKKITWNAGADWPGYYSANVRFRVTADDLNTPPAPSGMVLIPAGNFTIGDNLDGDTYAQPTHTVYVSAFYIDKFEVTKQLWDSVFTWAVTNGYSFDNAGLGKGTNHPVHSVSWCDAVKWCNARSEKEGKTAAYYTEAEQTNIYRNGQFNVENSWVKWNAGYRLPTEAEWEKAARGGLSGKRFPWGDNITHNQANYCSDDSYFYDTSATRGHHPDYYQAFEFPYTSPVGAFAANEYGLYDMAGNVIECCWDSYSESYDGPAPTTDPRGPASGSHRVLRGGGWENVARYCRTAYRGGTSPWFGYYAIGFRTVLPPGPK